MKDLKTYTDFQTERRPHKQPKNRWLELHKKIKAFCFKEQLQEWEEIFTLHLSDKNVCIHVYIQNKELLHLNNKKTTQF